MKKNSLFIVPFLCVIFTLILLVGTIFSAKANYNLTNFQESSEETTETATEAPTSTPSPTFTEEQLPQSTSTTANTSTETESTSTSTAASSYTPEPSLTPSPSPTDTLEPTPLTTPLAQNPSPTLLPAFHYPYLRPPEGFKPKTGDLTRPYLQAVASTWGSIDMDSNGKLNQPFDVDTDTSGNVYVADAQNRRIKVYTPSGTLLRQWGSWGDEEGQFYHPFSIAVDKYSSVGYVYVADDWTNEISKFDLYGNFLARWNIDAAWLTGVAVPPNNSNIVYVSMMHSSGNYEIAILNPNNSNIDYFTPTIYGNPLSNISDIAINSQNQIYIGDGDNGQVHWFEQNFTYKSSIGDNNDICSGQANTFCGEISLAIDGNTIYVSDQQHIQKFDLSLNYNSSFGSIGSGNGQFNYPQGIGTANGIVYVADTYNNRIQKFNANGVFQTKWGSDTTANGLLNMPQAIAANSNGVYIADTYNHRIQKFSSSGAFQTKWGSQGDAPDPFKYTIVPDVAFDRSNNVYLIDQWNNRIIKTNPNGTFIGIFGGSYGYGELQFRGPWSLALDKNDNLFIGERDNHRIQVISQSNTHLNTFDLGDGCINGGVGWSFTLTIDRVNNLLYIFDSDQNRVIQYVITYSGSTPTITLDNPTYVWGNANCTYGEGLYEFSKPVGGSVDSAGRLYVADRWNATVKVYDPNTHKFLGKWGDWGNGLGQFFELTDVTVDPNGYVYTIDNANGYRIQRFEPFFLDTAPPKPILTSPSGTVTNTFMPVYRWKTTAGAFRYELRIDAGEGKIFNPQPYCNADSCEVWLFTPLAAGAHT